MKKYKLYQIDAFTKEKFTGNPAGVITNADGLNEFQMQKIARELNNSETAFVFSSDSEVHLRYFTPTSEVPICGHATIAAHYARAMEHNLSSTVLYHKTGAGILPVKIVKYEDKDDYEIIMIQGNIEFGSILCEDEQSQLLTALGISNQDLLNDHPIQIVSTGHSKVLIGIKDLEVLHGLKPNYEALSKLSDIIACNGYYVYTFHPNEDILIHGRMFAPATGINEDPVTGNANGPLGAYLIHHNLVEHNNSFFEFQAKQGEAIGRTGLMKVSVKIAHQHPIEVAISGNAVIVFQSELIL